MPSSVSVKALAEVEIFRNLSQAEVQTIHDLVQEVTVGATQFLFREGERGDGLFILVTGEIEVLKRDRSGHERSLATVGNGAVLGEMSLINGSALRSASARTLRSSLVLKIATERFQDLLARDSVAALKMVHNFALVMSRRLAMVNEKLVDLLQKTDHGQKEELGEFQKVLQDWSF
jgi:CRP-like cAMP-binding protein